MEMSDRDEGGFNKETIGNVRFEFFTNLGSLSIEAWYNTRVCKVTTYSSGVRRRTEVKLDSDGWDRLISPVARSGFWTWAKRYDSHRLSGYAPSWRFSLLATSGWYHSSGDGEYPDRLIPLLRELSRFASEVEGAVPRPVERFLSPFMSEEGL